MPLHVPAAAKSEEIAQAVWNYTPRTLTELQSAILSAIASQVWGHATRELTYYPPGVSIDPIAEGTLTADGTEQTVIEITADSDMFVYGWLSLNAMDSGDTVIIKSYIDMGDGYITHAVETYEDAQTKPAVFFVGRLIKSGWKYKVTLQQTAGTYRDFPYSFVKEVFG